MLKLSYGNIISTIILLVSMGIWVGGTEAKIGFNEKLDIISKNQAIISKNQDDFEKQILVWLDDAEKQRKTNHHESMNHIRILHEYNKSQNPLYIIPESPKTQLIYQ